MRSRPRASSPPPALSSSSARPAAASNALPAAAAALAVTLVLAGAAADCGHAPARAPAPPAGSTVSAIAAPSNAAGAGVASSAPGAPIVLTVVGTSDVHGHVESLPVLGAYVDALRAERGADAVLLVDAGDMFQGTLDSNLGEGTAMVHGYDALAYDAVAFGNHEFDFGPAGPHATAEQPGEDPQGALKARAAEAHFPMLTANVDDAATGKPVAWPNVHPGVTVVKRGVTVGLVGVTSEDTPHTTIAANFTGLAIEPLPDAIARESAALRRAGATIVVLLAHAGGDCKDLHDPHDLASCDPKSEIMHAVEKLPAGTLDAVVAGHTHAGMSQIVAGVPIIQSFSVGRAFGRMDLTIDPRTKKVSGVHLFPPTPLKLPATYDGKELSAPDAKVAAAIAPDVARARARKEEKIGVHLETDVKRSHGSESALGNLFADLMRASHPDADVAVTNGGGLRADLPAGDLTYGRLFEAMPFDNRFAVVRMKGRELRALLAKNLAGDGGILSVSGIHVTAACKPGKGLDVTIERDPNMAMKKRKNKIVADDDDVTLVTSDFLATGGDGFAVEESPTVEPMLVRDAFDRGLRARGGTLRATDLLDPAHRRMAYAGERPVRCN